MHVGDVVSLTNMYKRWWYEKPATRDDGAGGEERSMPAGGGTPKQFTADDSSGIEIPSAYPREALALCLVESQACVSLAGVTLLTRLPQAKRVRTRRVVTDVSTLGEINFLCGEDAVHQWRPVRRVYEAHVYVLHRRRLGRPVRVVLVLFVLYLVRLV